MAEVLNEIERIKRQEQAREWDKNEKAMLEKLAALPPVDLAEHREVIGPFLEFCTRHAVRWCPARPAVIATFLAECAYRGEEFALKVADSISAFHQHNNLADPTATRLVEAALGKIITVEPPRWPKEDKIIFARLPTQIKLRIAERETQRDNALRRSQTLLAEERQRLLNENKTERTTVGNSAQPVKGTERISCEG